MAKKEENLQLSEEAKAYIEGYDKEKKKIENGEQPAMEGVAYKVEEEMNYNIEDNGEENGEGEEEEIGGDENNYNGEEEEEVEEEGENDQQEMEVENEQGQEEVEDDDENELVDYQEVVNVGGECDQNLDVNKEGDKNGKKEEIVIIEEKLEPIPVQPKENEEHLKDEEHVQEHVYIQGEELIPKEVEHFEEHIEEKVKLPEIEQIMVEDNLLQEPKKEGEGEGEGVVVETKTVTVRMNEGEEGPEKVKIIKEEKVIIPEKKEIEITTTNIQTNMNEEKPEINKIIKPKTELKPKIKVEEKKIEQQQPNKGTIYTKTGNKSTG